MAIEMALLMGLWIVSIATVPLYFWYKSWQRKTCVHDYQIYRVCSKCGKKEKQVESVEE